MPMKIYTYNEDGKFIEQRILLSDKEEGMRLHKVIYNYPTDVSFTRVRPLKDKEGYDLYFIDNKWEYREKQEQIQI